MVSAECLFLLFVFLAADKSLQTKTAIGTAKTSRTDLDDADSRGDSFVMNL
jgi:hypothetical protein